MAKEQEEAACSALWTEGGGLASQPEEPTELCRGPRLCRTGKTGLVRSSSSFQGTHSATSRVSPQPDQTQAKTENLSCISDYRFLHNTMKHTGNSASFALCISYPAWQHFLPSYFNFYFLNLLPIYHLTRELELHLFRETRRQT